MEHVGGRGREAFARLLRIGKDRPRFDLVVGEADALPSTEVGFVDAPSGHLHAIGHDDAAVHGIAPHLDEEPLGASADAHDGHSDLERRPGIEGPLGGLARRVEAELRRPPDPLQRGRLVRSGSGFERRLADRGVIGLLEPAGLAGPELSFARDHLATETEGDGVTPVAAIRHPERGVAGRVLATEVVTRRILEALGVGGAKLLLADHRVDEPTVVRDPSRSRAVARDPDDRPAALVEAHDRALATFDAEAHDDAALGARSPAAPFGLGRDAQHRFEASAAGSHDGDGAAGGVGESDAECVGVEANVARIRRAARATPGGVHTVSPDHVGPVDARRPRGVEVDGPLRPLFHRQRADAEPRDVSSLEPRDVHGREAIVTEGHRLDEPNGENLGGAAIQGREHGLAAVVEEEGPLRLRRHGQHPTPRPAPRAPAGGRRGHPQLLLPEDPSRPHPVVDAQATRSEHHGRLTIGPYVHRESPVSGAFGSGGGFVPGPLISPRPQLRSTTPSRPVPFPPRVRKPCVVAVFRRNRRCGWR